MTKVHALGLVASLAISFATNHVLRPRLDYAALGEGSTLPSGELVISGGARTTLKLTDMRVIAASIDTLFGGPVTVREILIRGALIDGQTETDLELFVDLTDNGAPITAARRIDGALGKALPLLERAVGGDARSRVRLPGSDSAASVRRGALTIEEALELEPGVWRVRGSLDAELDRADAPLVARISGKLIWP